MDHPFQPVTAFYLTVARDQRKNMAANPIVNVNQAQNRALNLQVLQRRDPEVMNILGTASHVVVYIFDHEKQEWVSGIFKTQYKSCTGSLFGDLQAHVARPDETWKAHCFW